MKDITLNYGAIRDSISRLASQEILKENKNDSLNKFITNVKKSPVLLKQHLVFKNFEDCKPFTKESLAERYIAQNLSILKGINWQNILKENRDVRIIMLENSHVESNAGEKNELFNHIQTLVESVTRPGYTKIDESQASYEFILEHLTRNIEESKQSLEEKENPDFLNWEFITNMAVNNFNKRFAHLNESDKKVFNMLISESNNKINYIEDLKNENISLIDGILNESEDISEIKFLEDFKVKMNSLNMSENIDYDECIIEYSELNENLKEIKGTTI